MADSKQEYSKESKYYVEVLVPSKKYEQERYDRSKIREKKFNENWKKLKVNLNELIEKYAPGSHGEREGVKVAYHGPKYTVYADMPSGYVRVQVNGNRKKYLDINGKVNPDKDHTHFKILKREEM